MLYSRAQDRPVKTLGYITRLPPWMHCICQESDKFPQNCRPWCWHWISLPGTWHAATRWGHFCGSASSRHWDNPPGIQWVLWSLTGQPLQVLRSSWFGRCVRCRPWMDAPHLSWKAWTQLSQKDAPMPVNTQIPYAAFLWPMCSLQNEYLPHGRFASWIFPDFCPAVLPSSRGAGLAEYLSDRRQMRAYGASPCDS